MAKILGSLVSQINSLNEIVKKVVIQDKDLTERLLKAYPSVIIPKSESDSLEKFNHYLKWSILRSPLYLFFDLNNKPEENEERLIYSNFGAFRLVNRKTIVYATPRFWIGSLYLRDLNAKNLAEIIDYFHYDAGGGGFGDFHTDIYKILIANKKGSLLYNKMEIGEPIAFIEKERLFVLGDYKRREPENTITISRIGKYGKFGKPIFRTKNGKRFIQAEEPGTFKELSNNF